MSDHHTPAVVSCCTLWRLEFRWSVPSFAIALALMSILTACHRQTATNRPAEQTINERPSKGTRIRTSTHLSPTHESFVPKKTIEREAVGLKDGDSLLGSNKDNWPSESFSDAAGNQLKRLSKLLISPGSVDAHKLAGLVAKQIRGGKLRPENLHVAFEDEAFIVRREVGARTDDPLRTDAFRGVLEFAQAAKQLLAPLQQATAKRCDFKIFRVTTRQAKGTAETEVQFELSGRSLDGFAVQKTAIWHCQWQHSLSSLPLLKSIYVSDYEECVGHGRAAPFFSDCTEAVMGHNTSYRDQLAYSLDDWLARIETRYGIKPSGWQGLTVGDVNGDGLDDLYVCQPGGLPNRLFVQQTNGTVSDVSAAARVDWRIHTHGALLIDVDNDDDQDLVLATALGLIFMSNDGTGSFQPKVAKLVPEALPISLAAADYDNDGDLDIYACCYGHRMTSQVLGRPMPYHDANNGGRNVMFRNDQSWRFKDVTIETGLERNNRRFSLSCAWEDFDNDGDLDLYVANDYGRNNLYQNRGGKFTDVAAKMGVEDISAGMSVSWGDYNNDGWMDLYVGNMWSSAGNRIAYQRQFLHSTEDQTALSRFRRHARGNSLFVNRGDHDGFKFVDVSQDAGVTMGRWAWASQFVDINNDGREDLIVANGFITQEDTRDL